MGLVLGFATSRLSLNAAKVPTPISVSTSVSLRLVPSAQYMALSSRSSASVRRRAVLRSLEVVLCLSSELVLRPNASVVPPIAGFSKLTLTSPRAAARGELEWTAAVSSGGVTNRVVREQTAPVHNNANRWHREVGFGAQIHDRGLLGDGNGPNRRLNHGPRLLTRTRSEEVIPLSSSRGLERARTAENLQTCAPRTPEQRVLASKVLHGEGEGGNAIRAWGWTSLFGELFRGGRWGNIRDGDHDKTAIDVDEVSTSSHTRSSSASSSSSSSSSSSDGTSGSSGPSSFPVASASPSSVNQLYRRVVLSSEQGAGRQAAEGAYSGMDNNRRRGAPAGGSASRGTAGAGRVEPTLYVRSSAEYAQETGHISSAFDPAHNNVHREAAKRWLRLPPEARIWRLEGFQGGLNRGVYGVEVGPGTGEGKVIKVVRAGSRHPLLLSEAENCHKQKKELPGLATDQALTFPSRIIRLVRDFESEDEEDLLRRTKIDRTEVFDVFLMRRARGQRLDGVLAAWLYRGSKRHRVFALLTQLGRFLRAFHLRYPGKQHGDVHPSNIFYEESSGLITLIDVGGLGQMTKASDVEYFTAGLKRLEETYGSELASKGVKAFEDGYKTQYCSTYEPRVV